MTNRFVNDALSELQEANRTPIYGYQHLHVTSLEQAVEKIIPIFPEVKEYIVLAKQDCNRITSILTWDESAAIYLYSMPIGFYARLNEYLRAENRDALKPWFAFLKLFITALEKLPSCDIVVWRGVASDVGAAFVDNDIQTWWSVNSCSKALNVVEIYLGNTGTVFAIDAANAKDITEFSVFQEEQEVILMPGSQFCVKSNSLNFKNSLFIVHLKEESASGEKKKTSSARPSNPSIGRRFERDTGSRFNTSVDRSDQTITKHSTNDVSSRYNAFTKQTNQEGNAQVSSASATNINTNSYSIWEPAVTIYLERSLNFRCLTEKPFKARSLPKEMKYGNSKIMSANNEFVLLCGNNNLHLFDENLKLVRSTTESPISSYNLVDMVWYEPIYRFLVLTKEKAYAFDPVTTQLACIERIRLQEEEYQFVSCTCSNDKLFIATKKSYCPSYMHCYRLPDFMFITRLTVTDLIGFDPPPKSSRSTDWAKKKQEDDKREIVSVRYNQQRLGMIMDIESNHFLYTLNLTRQPIEFAKTELSWRNDRLVVLAKSGEWLVPSDGYNDRFIQIALDGQFKTEWESKKYSQDSYFSFSTGFVNLEGSVTNAIMFGSSYLVLLLEHSLAMYNV